MNPTTLTTGSVFGNVIRFSLPYLLSYFLQTLYGMADLFIIGQFDGVASTTAVSIGSQVMHMLTVMIVGLAMGTTVSIARFVGAGNQKQVSISVGLMCVLPTEEVTGYVEFISRYVGRGNAYPLGIRQAGATQVS